MPWNLTLEATLCHFHRIQSSQSQNKLQDQRNVFPSESIANAQALPGLWKCPVILLQHNLQVQKLGCFLFLFFLLVWLGRPPAFSRQEQSMHQKVFPGQLLRKKETPPYKKTILRNWRKHNTKILECRFLTLWLKMNLVEQQIGHLGSNLLLVPQTRCQIAW